MNYKLQALVGQIPKELLETLENQSEEQITFTVTYQLQDQSGVYKNTNDAGVTQFSVLQLEGEKSTLDVYMKSNASQDGGDHYVASQYPGDPTNDGLHPNRPIDRFDTLYKKFPLGFRAGSRCNVHLACGGGTNNGFDGGGLHEQLVYQTEEILVGGHGANFNSYTYSGPPGMVHRRKIAGPDIAPRLSSSAADAAGNGSMTVLTFSNVNFTVGELENVETFLIAKESNDSTFNAHPIPLFRHTATQFWIPDSASLAGAFPVDGHYYTAAPGALIVSNRDYDTTISGLGCLTPGFLQKNGTDPDAQNPRPTLANMTIPGARITADGIWADAVSWADHPVIVTGANYKQTNCMYTGGLYLHGGSGRTYGWRNNTHGNTTNREYGSYIHPGFTYTAPYYGCDALFKQKNSGSLSLGMHIAGGSSVGGDEGDYDRSHHSSGSCLIYRGIYGYGLSTPLVYASDHASFGMIEFATMFCYNVPVGVHVTDYAKARLYGNWVFFDGTNTANLKIGGNINGATTGDPVQTRTLASWKTGGRNWHIGRPYIPADTFAAGVPATDQEAYGCHARIYE